MRIIRHDANQGAIDTQETKTITDGIALDRVVYHKLSNRTDNKVLTTPLDNSSEYDRFLLDMNGLFYYRDYPGAGYPAPTAEFVALDEYLSTLGITAEYPFQDDMYHIEPWIEYDERPTTRNVIDQTGNIIDRATGYNVVHNTTKKVEVLVWRI